MASTIGGRIRNLREAKGWTQEELCIKVGMNNTVLSKIESDKRKIESQELATFADVFEVTTDYLTGRTISFSQKVKMGEGIKEQSASYAKDSGTAYYGGGEDWTDEEREAAEAFVDMLRSKKKKKQEDK